MTAKDKLFQKGQEALMKGKEKESVGFFTSAIDAGYDTDVSLLSRGVAYFKLKDYDRAIDDFTCIMDSDKKRDKAYYYRGLSYMPKEDFTHAVSDLKKALEFHPDNPSAHLARAISLTHLGKLEEADKEFKDAVILSDVNIQQSVDAIGIVRTQFDRALAVYDGDRRPDNISLTEKEFETLKEWASE